MVILKAKFHVCIFIIYISLFDLIVKKNCTTQLLKALVPLSVPECSQIKYYN